MQLTDVVVRDTRPAAVLNDGGDGIVIEDGATAKLTRVATIANRETGIQVRGASHLTASHLVVRDTLTSATTGRDGVGLDVVQGSDAAIDHALFSGNRTGAVGVNGSTVKLSDALLRGTACSMDSGCSALQARQGGMLEVHRVQLGGNERVALVVEAATLSGDDLEILQTQTTPGSGEDGTAVAAQAAAQINVSRVHIEDSRTVAIFATDMGTRVEVEDLSVRQTRSDVPGFWGRSLHVQGSAAVTLRRAELTHSADVGVFVGSASVDASDIRVEDIEKRACLAAHACDDIGGSAVAVIGNGIFTAHRFSIARSAQCGLQLAEGGTATLVQGSVTGHLIGACIATDGFDVSAISDQVAYTDNTRNLDAQTLPLPSTRTTRY